MKFGSKFTIPTAMVALALGSAPLMARQSAPMATPSTTQAAKPESKSVQGELVQVDVDKKMVTIKAADEKEMSFRFTDATEVTGAGKNVEGLATKTGTKVIVDYEGQGASMVATKIAIQPADSTVSPAPSTPAPQPAPHR